MDDLESRLTTCFNTVFPKFCETDVASVSMTTFREWDSMKMITLILLIEEEFDVTIQAERIEKLTSFQSLLSFLKGLSEPS